MKISLFCIGLFIGLGTNIVQASTEIFAPGWHGVEAGAMRYGLSASQKLDGRYSAYIDHMRPGFDLEHHFLITSNEGYIAQTIDPKFYLGRHLHISAFAKAEKLSFDELVEQYRVHLVQVSKKRIEEYRERVRDKKLVASFKKTNKKMIEKKVQSFKRRSWRRSQRVGYGISVYVHTDEEIYYHDMTRPPASKFEDWDRFNVEVGIPQNCTAITVSFWFSGLGKGYVDHFAVVDQGSIDDAKEVRGGRLSARWRKDELVNYLRGKEMAMAIEFENLSFDLPVR